MVHTLSHTGRVVSLGKLALAAVSFTKQKIVVSLSDSVVDGIGVAELLRSFGYEDNM